MGKIIRSTYALLSTKKVTWLILAAVIIARILQLLFLFNTRNDMSYQIIAAQSFYTGHGVSLPRIMADDLSLVQYDLLVQWPPGFSLLFVPFYALCGQDYLFAALLVNILSALVLVFVCRGTLKLLSLPLPIINLFTLFSGFSLSYFYLKPCTDSTAISFLLLAVYFSLSLLASEKRWLLKTAGIALALWCCAFIKYLYLPVVFVAPGLLLAKGFSSNDSRLRKAGAFIFSFLILATFAYLFQQSTSSGTVGYIKEPSRGWFPENLLAAHPFFPASLLKPETVEWFAGQMVYKVIMPLFQVVHVFMLLLFLWYGHRALLRNRQKKLLPVSGFYSIGFVLSVAITFLLVFLSLRVAKEFVDAGQFWTYVEEPRYYGAIHVFLQLAVFSLYRFTRFQKKLKLIFYGLLLLMVPELVRGMVFTGNRLVHLGREEYGWQTELKFQRLTAKLLAAAQTSEKEAKPVLIGTSDWMTVRASLYNKIPFVEDVSVLNHLSSAKTTKPVLLFVMIRDEQLTEFMPFILAEGTRFLGSGERFRFYSHLLLPL